MSPETLARQCPQCGGPVQVPHGLAYVRCGHCGSTSFIDLSGTLLHRAIGATLPRARVPGRLVAAAREAGYEDVTVREIALIREPVWELDLGRGHTLHIGARPGPDGRYAELELGGGERTFVDPTEIADDAGWQEPELAPEAVEEVAARVTGRPVSVRSIQLVHRPVYHVSARVGAERRRMRVDAVSGDPLDADWPSPTGHRARNRLWIGTAAMIAAAALLPLPWAAGAVLAIAIGVLVGTRT